MTEATQQLDESPPATAAPESPPSVAALDEETAERLKVTHGDVYLFSNEPIGSFVLRRPALLDYAEYVNSLSNTPIDLASKAFVMACLVWPTLEDGRAPDYAVIDGLATGSPASMTELADRLAEEVGSELEPKRLEQTALSSAEIADYKARAGARVALCAFDLEGAVYVFRAPSAGVYRRFQEAVAGGETRSFRPGGDPSGAGGQYGAMISLTLGCILGDKQGLWRTAIERWPAVPVRLTAALVDLAKGVSLDVKKL